MRKYLTLLAALALTFACKGTPTPAPTPLLVYPNQTAVNVGTLNFVSPSGDTCSETVICNTPVPTPTPSPTPAPTPTNTNSPTPTPVPTPTPNPSPTPCMAITAVAGLTPVSGMHVSGTAVPISTTDSCTGNHFERILVDGVRAVPTSDFPTGAVVFDTTQYMTGVHLIQVNSQSINPNSQVLDSKTISLTFVAPTPTPVPTATSTPIGAPTHFSTLGYRVTLPSQSQCTTWASAISIPEHASWNIGYNKPPANGVPAGFYTNPTPSKGDNQSIPDFATVTGNFTGSTDQIIRWAACKWGIDENVVRAQGWIESGWHNNNSPIPDPDQAGDQRFTHGECVNGNFSALLNYECTGSPCCYQSWSMFQTKVYYEYTTWPMMRDSTPFAADYRYADTRSCMNGNYMIYHASHSANTYATDITNFSAHPGNMTYQDRVLWGCIGQHLSGSWYDAAAISYIGKAKTALAQHNWPGGVQLSTAPAEQRTAHSLGSPRGPQVKSQAKSRRRSKRHDVSG